MKVTTHAMEWQKQDNPPKRQWFCILWQQTIALSLSVLTDYSLVTSVLDTTGMRRYSALQRYSPPLDFSKFFSWYNPRYKIISLWFYVMDQHKIVHHLEVAGNITWISKLFTNKNLKSVECICTHPLYCETPNKDLVRPVAFTNHICKSHDS